MALDPIDANRMQIAITLTLALSAFQYGTKRDGTDDAAAAATATATVAATAFSPITPYTPPPSSPPPPPVVVGEHLPNIPYLTWADICELVQL